MFVMPFNLVLNQKSLELIRNKKMYDEIRKYHC